MRHSSGRSLPHPPSRVFVATPPLCVVLSGGVAALIVVGQAVAAGVVALLCAALLVTADVAARDVTRDANAPPARRFQFGSRVAGAIFDASILLPLAWTQRVVSPRLTAIALVGLTASYLVSYQLARGQALGYMGWESVPYRIGTATLLLFAVLAGSVQEVLLEVPLWLFAAVSAAGAVKRARDVGEQERETVSSRRDP